LQRPWTSADVRWCQASLLLSWLFTGSGRRQLLIRRSCRWCP